MKTTEINRLLKNYKKFLGTFPCDKIPKPKIPCFIIINTDPANEPGEHWVCVHVKKNNYGFYFDSFGNYPLNFEIIDFMNKNCFNGWNYNKMILQHTKNLTCGHWCVFYIKLKSWGFSYSKFIKLFSKVDQKRNDLMILKVYKLLKNDKSDVY